MMRTPARSAEEGRELALRLGPVAREHRGSAVRTQIQGLMGLLLAAALVLAPGVGLGQTTSDAGAALARRFPAEIAGRVVDVSAMDGQAWFDAWFGEASAPAEAAAFDALLAAQGRTPADMVVADAFFETSEDVGEIMAFQLPGAAAAELTEALIPLLTSGYEDLQRTELEVAGRSIMVVSDGAPDMEYGWLLALHPDDDVVWAAWASGFDLTEVVEAVLSASAAPQVPVSSFEPVADGPTASEVIMDDVAAGVLGEATGLLYRVHAATGDPLLPERYAAYPARDDDTALADAVYLFDTLPAEIQDALAPYVARPTDPRSIFHGGETTASGGRAIAALLTDQVPCVDGDWIHQASRSIPVVAWAPCSDEPGDHGVGETLATLEGLYPEMVRLMGDPVPDLGDAASGGDASIDVYIVSKLDLCADGPGRTTCIPGGAIAVMRVAPPFSAGPAATSSGYLVVDRARAEAGGPAFLSDVAHELFHLFEFAHNQRGTIVPTNTYHWFLEASAVWAEHHFVPEARATEVYPRLAEYQQNHAAGLASTLQTREYSAYVWPYFMEQERGPDAIADAWRAMEGKVGEAALDGALASVVPFETRFKEFAVRAWNAPLPAEGGGDAVEPRFQALDGAMPQLKPGEVRWIQDTLVAQARGADPIEVPGWLDSLDRFYREYVPDEDVEQVIFDFSGLHAGGDLDVEALLHRIDGGWERRALPDGETTFCLDPSGDDLDRIILVLANHSHLDEVDGTFSIRPLADPCAFWEGTMSEDLRWNKGGSSGEWTATFHGRWEPTPPDISYCDRDCTAYVPVGTVEWRANSAFQDCSRSQSGSLATGQVVTPQDQMLYLARDEEDHLRYWGRATLFGLAKGCLSHDGTGPTGPGGFFNLQEADADAPRSDERVGARPDCAAITWRIERDAQQITGSCWLDDIPGYEHRMDWDLQRVGAEDPPG